MPIRTGYAHKRRLSNEKTSSAGGIDLGLGIFLADACDLSPPPPFASASAILGHPTVRCAVLLGFHRLWPRLIEVEPLTSRFRGTTDRVTMGS